MRKKLKAINNHRKTFIGVFKRYGTRNGFKGRPEKTILLVDIKNNGTLMTDHIWFPLTKGFQSLGPLTEGQKVMFDARVGEYVKGYKGGREDDFCEHPIEEDYKLKNPSNIKLLSDDITTGSIQTQLMFS